MATANGSLNPSNRVLSGGLDASDGLQEQFVTVTTGIGAAKFSDWVFGDTFTLIFTDALSGLQTQVGAGLVSGVVPTFCMSFQNKVYILDGNTVSFSSLGSAITWNDLNASGNGNVQMNNWSGTPEPIVAIVPYQGKLAFFARRTTQTWNINADPSQWSLSQLFTNTGTLAPLSCQALGDLDVVYLSDTGVRSLRVRDSSLNAFVNDFGSPIDQLIENSLIAGSDSSNAAACGVVEPVANRYWLYLNGVIYVLSYFLSNKILAWSTFSPKDSNGTAFVAKQFVIYQGQVWVDATDPDNNNYLLQYGGTDNNTFDTTKLKVQTPFLDGKAAGTYKNGRALDLALNSLLTLPDTIKVYVSMDPTSAGDPTSDLSKWRLVYTGKGSTFDILTIPYSDRGTHFSVYIESQGDGNAAAGGPALFSELIFHYEAGEQKA